MATTKSIKVITPGPVKVSRAETAGKASAFISGGPVKVETLPPLGEFRLIGLGAPGTAGADGAPGPQGPAGPPGDPGELGNLALDGGNF